ncbi:MAG: hypothetical protein ACLR31_02645 [Escherichia coli]
MFSGMTRVMHVHGGADEDPLGVCSHLTIPSAWGEDGPTHQPVEQLAPLRLTPNMETWRGWRSGGSGGSLATGD